MDEQKKPKIIQAANIITLSRFLFGVLLLFFPAFSVPFTVFYLLAGLSDMLDGPIARLTRSESDFGAGLDSAADIVFVAAGMVRLIPALTLPVWVFCGIALVAVVKLVNILSGLTVQKAIVFKHTRLNKLAGFLLFVFPLTVSFLDPQIGATVVLAVALFAALQEGHLIRTGN